ncbi:hypothetical protein A2U01_0067052, partial [Trifolium medium]|nr:hypothetical protein [Trifolium medium]
KSTPSFAGSRKPGSSQYPRATPRRRKVKTEFSNLAEFANNVVRGISSIHKRAYDVMLPDNTSATVFDFVEIYGTVLKEFKASLDAAREARL